jgi:hypothetical protein
MKGSTATSATKWPGKNARYFFAWSPYTGMTYSKAAPRTSYALGWFVPPLVVPALLAALFLAWVAYQALS